MPLCISFSSSGLLLTYELGVAERLAEEPHLLGRVTQFLGASGGALIASLLCCAPEKIGMVKAYMLSGNATKGMTLSDLWDPADRLLPRFFEETQFFAPGACDRCSGRLFISCTKFRRRKRKREKFTASATGASVPATIRKQQKQHQKEQRRKSANQMFSTFSSNEELVRVLQASCSFDLKGVPLGSVEEGKEQERFWDGGMSDALPLPQVARPMSTSERNVLITVCPFSSMCEVQAQGQQGQGQGQEQTQTQTQTHHIHISPRIRDYTGTRTGAGVDEGAADMSMQAPWAVSVWGGITCHVSLSNLARAVDTTIPRGAGVMNAYMRAGWSDADTCLKQLAAEIPSWFVDDADSASSGCAPSRL